MANSYDYVSGLHVCVVSFTDKFWQKAKLNIPRKKKGHFDTCLIFAVDCILLVFCLFVPGTMCTGGRLAKTGVNSATVSRLGHSNVQSADVPWSKGHELCSWLG